MKRLLPLLALAAAACGAPIPLHTLTAASPSSPAPQKLAVELPATLDCVSGTLSDTNVVRASLVANGDTVDATLTRGALFATHDTLPAREQPAQKSEQRTLMADVVGGAAFHLGDAEIDVDIAKDGDAFAGTIAVGGESAPLTCWDHAELFGSPWSFEGGSLVRFDWETHSCPRMNHIPVEVVRETGFGECTDLSGAALNGDDFGMPALDGWDLTGAKLDGATLFFADMHFASLNGADLSGLQFGYATISGFSDESTKLPVTPEGACSVESSPWSGDQLTCAN
jgi:hypothetical protein